MNYSLTLVTKLSKDFFEAQKSFEGVYDPEQIESYFCVHDLQENIPYYICQLKSGLFSDVDPEFTFEYLSEVYTFIDDIKTQLPN
jgi:hypothetical protein